MTALNDFYGFQLTPFTKSIATRDLFPSRGYCEVQARLTFALQERLPALVTGEVGAVLCVQHSAPANRPPSVPLC
jgi:hypothetical protein